MTGADAATRTPGRDALDKAFEAAQCGNGLTALDILRGIIASPPLFGERWAAVVKLCGELGDDDAALAAARRLRAAAPSGVPTAFILARALETTGRVAEAVAVLEPVARAGKLNFSELFHLSRMLMFAGQLDQARKLAARLLRQEPGNPFLWERVAQLKRFAAGDPDITRLVQLQTEVAAAPPRPRASAAWALAKAYVDFDDDRMAAPMLEAAAAARREVVAIDLASVADSAGASLEAIPLDELKRVRRDRRQVSRVIFIHGPQRSGTPLVEQILSRHPTIAGGGELKFLGLMRPALGNFTNKPIADFLDQMHRQRPGQDPWEEIRRRYFALADERFGTGALFTDKLLSNHLRLAVILRAFPGARIIRCRRNALDVAWSCWRAQFNEDSWWNSDPTWIARYIAVYERLLDTWAERIPDLFINVDYERLVADPDAAIPELLAGCGLTDHPATRRPQDSTRGVMTSSFLQVREAIHPGQVGASRRFPIATRPLREALAAEGLALRA
jgi:tetratricopeptide (TPR) repeat protein